MSIEGLATRQCVVITGATSGIGQALAFAIAELPHKPKVIVTGRRQDRLDEMKAKGFDTTKLDLSGDLDTLKSDVEDLIHKYPELDAVILNAGYQAQHDTTEPEKWDRSSVLEEIQVNYIANEQIINTTLPRFKTLDTDGRHTSIITVTSALGITPSPGCSNYSATKAALHSYTTALRASFSGTKINVVELVPPLVESELHDNQAPGTAERLSKIWMPLQAFIDEVMPGLVNGDGVVAAGVAADSFKRHEEGKFERAMFILEHSRST